MTPLEAFKHMMDGGLAKPVYESVEGSAYRINGGLQYRYNGEWYRAGMSFSDFIDKVWEETE